MHSNFHNFSGFFHQKLKFKKIKFLPMLFYFIIKIFVLALSDNEQIEEESLKGIIDSVESIYVFIKDKHENFRDIFEILNKYYSDIHYRLYSQNNPQYAKAFDDIKSIQDRFKDHKWDIFNTKFISKHFFNQIDDEKIIKLYAEVKQNIIFLKKLLQKCKLWQNKNETKKHFDNLCKTFFKNKSDLHNKESQYFYQNYRKFIDNRIEEIKKISISESEDKNFHLQTNPFPFFNENNLYIHMKAVILLYYGTIKKLERFIFFVSEICFLHKTRFNSTFDYIRFEFFIDLIKNYDKCIENLEKLNRINNDEFFRIFFQASSLRKMIENFISLIPKFNELLKEREHFFELYKNDNFICVFLRLTLKSDMTQSIKKLLLPNDLTMLGILININFVMFEEWYEKNDFKMEIYKFIYNYLEKHRTHKNVLEKIYKETNIRLLKLKRNEFEVFKTIIFDYFLQINNIKKEIFQDLLVITYKPFISALSDLSNVKALYKLFDDVFDKFEKNFDVTCAKIEEQNYFYNNLKVISFEQIEKIIRVFLQNYKQFINTRKEFKFKKKSVNSEISKHIGKFDISNLQYAPDDHYYVYGYIWFVFYSNKVNLSPHSLFCLHLFKFNLTQEIISKEHNDQEFPFNFLEKIINHNETPE